MKKTLLFLLFFANLGFAGEKNVAKTGFAFLKILSNPKLEAMGGVQTSNCENENALSSNPSGLGENFGTSVFVNHNSFLQGSKTNFVGLKTTSDKNAFGISVRLHNVHKIELRNEIPTNEPYGTTSANFLVANFSYARKHSQKLDYGVSAKYLYEDIFRETALGFAFDFGTRVHFWERKLNFGLSILNVGKMSKLATESTELPKSINLGLDYRLKNLGKDFNFIFAADYQNDFGNSTFYKTGLEIGYRETIFLRSGYRFGYEALGFSAGFGINWQNYSLDYSFTPYKENLGNSQNFSFKMLF
ncbi:PorV/PorQ family protein [bacterium]|nr:PorV/PorQ family protein [bacterium]